jgi:hypothetical protein
MGQRFFPLLLILLTIAACARQNTGVEPAQSPVAAVATATATRRPATPAATASTPADTATPVQTPAPPLTPTLAPSATRTPRPSQTPTPTPTLAIWVEVGTPMPGAGHPITPQNVTQITELARWGRGVIADIDLSADGRWLAVAAGSAVYIHETPEMTIPPRVVAATDTVSSIAISPTGERVAFADR